MSKYRKLTHVVYRCDYHIVSVPKYRCRVLTSARAYLASGYPFPHVVAEDLR